MNFNMFSNVDPVHFLLDYSTNYILAKARSELSGNNGTRIDERITNVRAKQ